MKSCLFIVCKTMFTIGESQAISRANRTANTRTPNCQSSQGKIWHQKILWSENADLKFNGPRNKDGDGINKQRAEGTSLNEFRMLKYFKSKWKRFWIISLNIWANITGTKHDLLADKPYRLRLLGFHCLHVNATKCIFVGFSLSKLQSFFWKISLNSRLIRLEGFNNKISTHGRVCSTQPRFQGSLLPALRSERERDPGKRWSSSSRTKLFLREESFVSYFFVWFIRDIHAMIATAR